jgi:hypothetical protein
VNTALQSQEEFASTAKNHFIVFQRQEEEKMPRDTRVILVSIMEAIKKAEPRLEEFTRKQLETALNYRGVSSNISIKSYIRMFDNLGILKENGGPKGKEVYKVNYENYEVALKKMRDLDHNFNPF